MNLLKFFNSSHPKYSELIVKTLILKGFPIDLSKKRNKAKVPEDWSFLKSFLNRLFRIIANISDSVPQRVLQPC